MENLYKHNAPFTLESGAILPEVIINYTTYGKLNNDKSNVVWICHALTANADAPSWWPGLVGDGFRYNSEEHFIVCANIIGSCYGSSGPLEINSTTGKPYFSTFPQYTIRDIVAVHELLRKFLQIDSIHTCIGGSLGGQQALEWAIMQPDLIQNLILLATNAFHSPWGIAFNEAQRMAIKADPTWNENSAHAGVNGLKAARAIALLSYRNYGTYEFTQSETDVDKLDNFKACSYQNYQGEKLVKRFNSHSYLSLSKAMDAHNVGRGRGSVVDALKKIKSHTLCIGVKTDILFPVSEQIFLSENIPGAQYSEIDSLFGHDGFLIETEKITKVINAFHSKEKMKTL